MSDTTILTGTDIQHLAIAALLQRIAGVDVFAEMNKSERAIILALKKAGNVVGYMGTYE